MPERRLSELVGKVGQEYLWRSLPPRWLMLGALAATIVAMGVARVPMAVLAIVLLAWSGLLSSWPRRRQPLWPGWRTAALILAVLLERGEIATGMFVCQAAVIAAGILATRHLVGVVWDLHQQARRMDRVAAALQDEQLLALMPPPARLSARRWQAGDDRVLLQVRAVVRLAALWLVTTCIRTDADRAPRALAVF